MIREEMLKSYKNDYNLIFDNAIRSHPPDIMALDIGCGPIYSHLGQLGISKVIGIDIDDKIKLNKSIEDKILATASYLPFNKKIFNLVIANDVIEHIECPEVMAREVSRVLASGGSFIFRTPNINSILVRMASMAPFSIHKWYYKIFEKGDYEPCPAFYRCNCSHKIRKVLTGAGFSDIEIEYADATPFFLRFHWFFLALGLLHQKLTYLPWLKEFSSTIICRASINHDKRPGDFSLRKDIWPGLKPDHPFKSPGETALHKDK